VMLTRSESSPSATRTSVLAISANLMPIDRFEELFDMNAPAGKGGNRTGTWTQTRRRKSVKREACQGARANYTARHRLFGYARTLSGINSQGREPQVLCVCCRYRH